jgi:hypothetical protein
MIRSYKKCCHVQHILNLLTIRAHKSDTINIIKTLFHTGISPANNGPMAAPVIK